MSESSPSPAPEMFHPVGHPSVFSYLREHKDVSTLPSTHCNYGLTVAGIQIGSTSEHCGEMTNVGDDIERWSSWDCDSDTLYQHIWLCPAHQVSHNDLGVALSGLIDLIDCGMLPFRMSGLGPIVLPSDMSLQDAAPLIANLLCQTPLDIEAPNAHEVAAHMTAEGADEWLTCALARLARLGYLIEQGAGRYVPTAYGKLCTDITRDELIEAGILPVHP